MKSTYGALFAALLCAGPASAVSLSARGEGQLLIYPYYTTADSNTLISLTNHRYEAKVVRLRVAEGENAAEALTIHIYLAPYDTWYGVLFDPGDGRTSLVSNDKSCTYPAINEAADLPQLPDGRRYLGLNTPATADPGSSGYARLREGFVEALEVATIRKDTPTWLAVTPERARQRDCAALRAAWEPGGYWAANPLRDLANPTGGIGGESAVVKVAEGVIFGMQAVAIDEFRIDPRDEPRGTRATVALHTASTRGSPPLSSLALTDPVARTARADVFASGKMVQLTYPAPSRAVDALSAVLMTSRLSGVYEEDPNYGARTSFVLTYPTRSLYTNPGAGGNPREPFQGQFRGLRPLRESDGEYFTLYDRDAEVLLRGTPQHCGFFCNPPTPQVRGPGAVVEVLAPGGTPDPLLGSRLHADMGYVDADNPYGGNGQTIPVSGMGSLEIFLSSRLSPSLEGYFLSGRPVIGTRLVNYVNANATPGMLANFSLAVPMSAETSCYMGSYQPCQP